MSLGNPTLSDDSTRTKTIARNSIWTSLDTLTSFFSSLLISVVVARQLGPENLGYFNFVIWITGLTGQLGYYGIGAATRKYVAEHLGAGDVAAANAIVRKNVRHQLWVATGIFLLSVPIIILAVPAPQRPFSFLAAGSLVPLLVMVIYGQALNAAENFRALVFSSVISTLTNLAATFILLSLGFGLTAVTFSLLLSRTVDLGLRFRQFRRHFPRAANTVQLSADTHLQQRMTKFYWQSSLLLVLNIVVWDRSELFVLKMFSSIKQLAFYSLAFNISTQILLFPQMIATSAGASMMVQYGRDSRKTGNLAGTAIRYMCLLAFPALVGAAAVAGPVLHLLYGSRYVEAIPVLTLLAILSLPRVLLLPAQQQLTAFERQTFLLGWGMAMAAINITLDLLLIRSYGAVGAAWANGISQSVASAGIVYYAATRLGLKINLPSIARILGSAMIMGAAVAGVIRLLPSIPGLLIGIPLGVVVYLVCLRITGALLTEDLNRFSLFLNRIPVRWRIPVSKLLQSLVATPSTL